MGELELVNLYFLNNWNKNLLHFDSFKILGGGGENFYCSSLTRSIMGPWDTWFSLPLGTPYYNWEHRITICFCLCAATCVWLWASEGKVAEGRTAELPPIQMQNKLPSTYNISLPAQFDGVPSWLCPSTALSSRLCFIFCPDRQGGPGQESVQDGI